MSLIRLLFQRNFQKSVFVSEFWRQFRNASYVLIGETAYVAPQIKRRLNQTAVAPCRQRRISREYSTVEQTDLCKTECL
jgi:hypothetical protein